MSLNQIEIAAIQASAECIYDAVAVQQTLDHMAADISAAMADALPVILCVMNGGLIMTGHLLTRLPFPLEIDYLQATRYRGNTRGAEVEWICKPRIPLQGRTVLVVDDILDEGNTLAAVLEYCRQAGASRVFSAVLVTKRHDRLVKGITADFVGLEVEDLYVFGFGMDYKGYLRNLNGIYALGKPGG
jgi:hypoxanthine phosphoribosyltransferase